MSKPKYYVDRINEKVSTRKPAYFGYESGDKAYRTKLSALRKYKKEVESDLNIALEDVHTFEEELERVNKLLKLAKKK